VASQISYYKMAIGCGAKCAKIVLIVYNIIFLLSGLFLIGLGIWLVADGRVHNLVDLTYNGTNSSLLRSAAIILITMGVLVVIISVIGFIAAVTENMILLIIYIVFLVVIFCGEICGGVVAIVFKDRIVYGLKNILQESLDKQLLKNSTNPYYRMPNTTEPVCETSDVGYLWDWAQITFECCGIETNNDGYSSRLTAAYNFKTMCTQLQKEYIPVSCCPFKNDSSDFGDFHQKPDNQYNAQKLVDCTNPYPNGCYNEVALWLEKYAPVLIGIGIGFAMLELFGIIFAVCLCRNTGDDD
jgi:hypothetical protein